MSDERQPLLATEQGDQDNHPQENETPRGRFTLLEKVLFGVTIVLFILLASFAGLYARRVYESPHGPGSAPKVPPGEKNPPHANETTPLCLTPQCVMAAAQILKDIDTTVDPCDDFYAYTCNNWERSHDIPEARSAINTFVTLSIENKEVLHSILSNDFEAFSFRINMDNSLLPDPEKLVDRQNFEKLKGLYDSCMDESAIDARGSEPILPLLRDVRDMYPTDFSTDEPQKLARSISFLAQHAIDALFELTVDADSIDPDRTSISLYQSGLTLPSRDYYKNSGLVQSLFEAVADTMEAVFGSTGNEFGWNRWSANTTARLVVDFEKSLAAISDSFEDIRDPVKSYNPRTLSQLAKLSPNLDWGLLMSRLVPTSAPHVDSIIVTSPNYLSRLSSEVLAKSTNRSLQAYLMWRVIETNVRALGEDIRRPMLKLDAKLQGSNAKVIPPRWDHCLDEVDHALGFMASRYFVLDKFNGDARDRADEFVRSIKDVFLKRLPELSWLDAQTRARAVEKVDKLVRKIGYPTTDPNVMSPVSLSDYYADLTIDPHQFFKNYLAAKKWLVKSEWQKTGMKPNRNEWSMTPQTVNAYYNPSFNEIVFPAGILQNPFFGSDYPDYLNYGGIGMVVGHELTHGFDNTGRQFDADGRLVEWWTNETSVAFDERARCFVKQYSNYSVPDPEGNGVLYVNGNLTLGENMADNGGLGESYLAWKARYESDPTCERHNNALLPGLEQLSPHHLFFINFGRVWCNKSTREQQRQQVLTNEHSPPRWRVNGAVQNSRHFANVFQCPLGSPMNPVNKCEVW